MTVPLIKAHACLTVFNTRRTAECYTICKALTRKEMIKIVPCQILMSLINFSPFNTYALTLKYSTILALSDMVKHELPVAR